MRYECIHKEIYEGKKPLGKNLCNKNQLVALFILSLFHQSLSTCLGHICSPTSNSTWPTVSQLKSTKRTNCFIYIYIYIYIYIGTPPDDGTQICPKHVEVD